MPPTEVADGVIRIDAPLPIAEPERINCYLLVRERVLVDTGMRGSEVAIDAALAQLGAPVDRVLITHGHPDHWGLAARYADTVLAHPDTRAQLRFAYDRDAAASVVGGAGGAVVLDDALFETLAGWRHLVEPPPEIEPIDEGDRIGEWRVLVTPGHAPGHVCLLRERDGVLIAGDTLLPAVTPNIHLTPEMQDAVADYLDSLDRISELDVSLVLPSHGEPYTDSRGRATELIAHHRRRLERLEHALADGPADTGALAAQLFRDTEAPADALLAQMETYAHLEHLRLRGRVALVEPGVWAMKRAA